MPRTKADTARRIADNALVWLMVLRVVVVTALLGSAVVAEVLARPSEPGEPLYLLIAFTYLLTLLYALAWPFTAGYRRELAYAQVLGDLLIVTGIVHSTGRHREQFFLPLSHQHHLREHHPLRARRARGRDRRLRSLWHAGPGALPRRDPPDPSAAQSTRLVLPAQVVAYTIFLNVFAFYTVALLTSYLSESLRLTGRKLEEASDSLADLEAFNQTIIDSITSGLMTTDLEGRHQLLQRGRVEHPGGGLREGHRTGGPGSPRRKRRLPRSGQRPARGKALPENGGRVL